MDGGESTFESDAARAMMAAINQAGAAGPSAPAVASAAAVVHNVSGSGDSGGNASVVTHSSTETTAAAAAAAVAVAAIINNNRNATTTTSTIHTQKQRPRHQLDFSESLECILSSLERRQANQSQQPHPPHHGPLKDHEIHKLSMLCTQQSLTQQQGNALAVQQDGQFDLGFADVDPDLVSQMVEVLETHVALASQICLIEAAYEASQNIQRRKPDLAYRSMDGVRVIIF